MHADTCLCTKSEKAAVKWEDIDDELQIHDEACGAGMKRVLSHIVSGSYGIRLGVVFDLVECVNIDTGLSVL